VGSDRSSALYLTPFISQKEEYVHKTNNWIEFFDKKFFNLFDRSLILKELVTQIRYIIRPPAAILEVGCGSGLTAVLLANIGYQVTAIDTNAEIIQKLKRFELVFPNIFFQQMDMFHLKFVSKNFNVSFSQGVLEHYSDDDIVRALVEQKKVAETIVVDVPNGRGKLGDYGDERTISVVKWREIIRKAGLTIIRESARGMSRWSQRNLRLFRWVENSWLSRRFGENSIFICKEV